jgi:hypothetical protein
VAAAAAAVAAAAEEVLVRLLRLLSSEPAQLRVLETVTSVRSRPVACSVAVRGVSGSSREGAAAGRIGGLSTSPLSPPPFSSPSEFCAE